MKRQAFDLNYESMNVLNLPRNLQLALKANLYKGCNVLVL